MKPTRSYMRRYRILFLWLAILPAVGQASLAAQAQSAVTGAQPPATILIIRHAEKLLDGTSGLSSAGEDRAQLLLKAFIPLGVRPDLPAPQFIFAAAPSPHSNRSALTVIPLAAALHLNINQDFKDHRYNDLAAELLSGRYAGKVVLLSWHHGKIPELAAALGAAPPYSPWPEQQFDRIWRIDYTHGKAVIRDLPYATAPPASK